MNLFNLKKIVSIQTSYTYIYVCLILFVAACTDNREESKIELAQKKQFEELFFQNSPAISLDSMKVLLKENEEKKNNVALTVLYREIGKKERQNSNFSEAIRLHRLGLDAAHRLKDTLEIIQALNNLGTDFRRLGMLPEAGTQHSMALQLAETYSQKNNDLGKKNKMIALNGIGNVAFSINLLDSAEYYFRKALREETISQNIQGQAINYANIGSVFEARQMYDSAFAYYEKSMKKNKEANIAFGVSLCYIHLGEIHKYKQQFKEAEEQYKKAYDLLDTIPDKWHWLEACLALAQLKMETKKEDEALRYIHKAKEVAETIKSPEHLSKIHRFFYEYDMQRSDYFSAINEYKLFKYYEDSLRRTQTTNEVVGARIQYEREKSSYDIAQVNALRNLEKQKKRTQNIIFLIIMIILFCSLVLLFYAFIQRTKSNKVLHDIEKIRSVFFTRITHEFRTPLTVILGLSKQLKKTENLSQQTHIIYLNAIERQGKNLLKLVNQLLSIARLRTSSITMEWRTGNLVAYTEMIAETFRLYAQEKQIELIFYSKEHDIETDFVPDYFNEILQNLLSNAIKHSKAGDKIFLIIERNPKDKRKIFIKVIDQGEGIGKENLKYIFDLFYQAPQNKGNGGSGIGLALTKELVEILGGKISVESKKDETTTFTVEFPICRDEKQIFAYWLPEKKIKESHPKEKKEPGKQEKDIRTTLLLVEDNKDVALYIKTLFPENAYHILYARNGAEGLSMANEFVPDIVITDIVMPLKSGIELCVDIRKSPLLNHIPIIILTAKNSNKDQVEGLKCGADAYIRKPFNAQELQVRVEKLLELRNLLKEKYRNTIFKEEKREEKDLNLDFLQRVVDIIHKEMKNPNFSSKKLAEELSISISQLNKKLNALAGYPASGYILQIKIAYAKKILTSKSKSISEVAMDCGIYDVNYFARIFKRITGVTPSQYQRLPR